MKLKKMVRDTVKEMITEPLVVNLSTKQFKSHVIYYHKKRELRFNEEYIKQNKNNLEKLIMEIKSIIYDCQEDIIYYQFQIPAPKN